MPSWPTSLPQRPLIEGYQETPPNVLLRTQMDAGPAKVRRRFTAGVRIYSVAYLLTSTQLTTLDSFFVSDCKHGSVSFTWPHPRTGANITVRFLEPPQYSSADQHWRVTCKFEELPA